MHSTKPSCFSAPKIKFGNKVWCSVHTPHEYTFSQYIKDSVKLQKESSDNDIPNEQERKYSRDDKSLNYHNSNHTYTPNELLYYWKRVVDNSPYEIEHLCCGGNGVVISLRRK